MQLVAQKSTNCSFTRSESALDSVCFVGQYWINEGFFFGHFDVYWKSPASSSLLICNLFAFARHRDRWLDVAFAFESVNYFYFAVKHFYHGFTLFDFLTKKFQKCCATCPTLLCLFVCVRKTDRLGGPIALFFINFIC